MYFFYPAKRSLLRIANIAAPRCVPLNYPRTSLCHSDTAGSFSPFFLTSFSHFFLLFFPPDVLSCYEDLRSTASEAALHRFLSAFKSNLAQIREAVDAFGPSKSEGGSMPVSDSISVSLCPSPLRLFYSRTEIYFLSSNRLVFPEPLTLLNYS